MPASLAAEAAGSCSGRVASCFRGEALSRRGREEGKREGAASQKEKTHPGEHANPDAAGDEAADEPRADGARRARDRDVAVDSSGSIGAGCCNSSLGTSSSDVALGSGGERRRRGGERRHRQFRSALDATAAGRPDGVRSGDRARRPRELHPPAQRRAGGSREHLVARCLFIEEAGSSEAWEGAFNCVAKKTNSTNGAITVQSEKRKKKTTFSPPSPPQAPAPPRAAASPAGPAAGCSPGWDPCSPPFPPSLRLGRPRRRRRAPRSPGRSPECRARPWRSCRASRPRRARRSPCRRRAGFRTRARCPAPRLPVFFF